MKVKLSGMMDVAVSFVREHNILPYECLSPFDLRQVFVQVSGRSRPYSLLQAYNIMESHLYVIRISRRVNSGQRGEHEADALDGM